MKKVIFLLLLSLSAQAAPPTPSAAIPTLTIGGRVFTDLTNLIVLNGACGGTNRGAFRKTGTNSGYTPSGSKAFKFYALTSTSVNFTSTDSFTLAYADNDTGINSATAFTNGVYVSGSASMFVASSVGVGYKTDFNPPPFIVPNGKYASLECAGSSQFRVTAYGYEQ